MFYLSVACTRCVSLFLLHASSIMLIRRYDYFGSVKIMNYNLCACKHHGYYVTICLHTHRRYCWVYFILSYFTVCVVILVLCHYLYYQRCGLLFGFFELNWAASSIFFTGFLFFFHFEEYRKLRAVAIVSFTFLIFKWIDRMTKQPL